MMEIQKMKKFSGRYLIKACFILFLNQSRSCL